MPQTGTMKLASVLTVVLLVSLQAGAQSVAIAKWRNNAQGAYSLIMDDFAPVFCYRELIDSVLENRSLHVSFATIAGSCGEDEWSWARSMEAKGHEFVNHSYSHTSAETWSGSDFDQELDQSKSIIESNIPGNRCLFFAFPFDIAPPSVVGMLRTREYIGTRGGVQCEYNPSGTDPFLTDFCVYYTLYPNPTMQVYLTNAIQYGQWAFREIHNIIDCLWEPVPLDLFKAHLDLCRQKIDAGELWMETVQNVIMYIMERDNYTASTASRSSSGFEIEFDTRSSEINPSPVVPNSLYDYPLTLLVDLPPGTGTDNVVVSQNMEDLPFTPVSSDRIMFDALPYGGNVSVSYSGTSTAGSRLSWAVLPVRVAVLRGGVEFSWDPVAAGTDVKLTVYSLKGRLIRSLDEESNGGRIVWDGLNGAGERVGPGGYLVAVSVEGDWVAAEEILLLP